MNKVLVKLYIPLIEEQYDVLIPLNRTIYSVINLLVKALDEFTGGYYKPNKMPKLYNKITAIDYDMNLKVKETEIRNGTEIILI